MVGLLGVFLLYIYVKFSGEKNLLAYAAVKFEKFLKFLVMKYTLLFNCHVFFDLPSSQGPAKQRKEEEYIVA
jgi:hypothetical protein